MIKPQNMPRELEKIQTAIAFLASFKPTPKIHLFIFLPVYTVMTVLQAIASKVQQQQLATTD